MACAYLHMDPSVNVMLVITVSRNMLAGHAEVGEELFTSGADICQASA